MVSAGALCDPNRPICMRRIGDADRLGVADLVAERHLLAHAWSSSLESEAFSSFVELCRLV
ncbi:hypothetical protein HanRHA438_Chr08g0347301 [Helianthus annuus]|nr:hypothetical protein HanIR_Chr08g0362681 [Helianthus annuus]KAJ0897585.1 hypothetical protein HanRHA438_Chr08g0347301 [Helianthus annuus]